MAVAPSLTETKAANRDLFASDPERYAPQYDGYCAVGVTGVDFAAPHKDTVDPEVWTIVDGKLYLAHARGQFWDEWRAKGPESVKRADEAWKYVKTQANPVIDAAVEEKPLKMPDFLVEIAAVALLN